MAKCTKPNYSTDKFSGGLTLPNVTPDLSVETLSNNIIDMLNNQNSFSISIDSSEDQENYSDSIDTLIEDINKQLPDSVEKSKLSKLLKSKLLPKQLTEIEKAITIAIPNSNLISEEERTAITYRGILHSIYGNSNFGIDQWRQMKFIDEIQQRTIIDTKNRTIIDSDQSLANNLIVYQENLFATIRSYLKNGLFSSYSFPQTLYRTNPKTGVKERVSTYTSVLQAMYNVIESKRESGELENELLNGWGESIANKQSPFYDAVMAYINLAYFDSILEQTVGDFININKEMESPIETIVGDDGVTRELYKYTRSVGNTNLGKKWGVEFEDSLDKLSKFSKVLINSIPLYSYETKELEFGKLQPKDFIGTWVKLKDIGSRVTDVEFSDAIIDLASETSMNRGSLQVIFNKLFEDRNNANLIQNLNDLDFNLADLNILYSVYRTVFNSKSNSSWLSIENKYAAEKGIKSRYNLVDTLFGLISSNSAMNYLQTTFDTYSKQYVTKVKDKFSISIPKFNIISNANTGIVNRDVDYSGSYKISQAATSWDVQIGNDNYTINIVKNNTFSLLMKEHTRFSIPNLVRVPKLNTYDRRVKLINGDNITEDEQKFLNVLSFIDTMLGTNLSYSERGLNEFYLASSNNISFFKQIFLSAARSLYIQNLYRSFRNATKSDGTQYSLTEFPQYLDSLSLGLPKQGNPTYRDYFNTQYNGEHLKVVGNNESWVESLAKVQTILSGDSSRSTIADLQGNKRPNSSPSFLGQEIRPQIKKSSQLGGAASMLLFSRSQRAIVRPTVDTDIELENGVKKLVRDLTEAELLTNSIVHKFWYPIKQGYVFIQPTTYSDKTKFLRYQISLKDISYQGNTLDKIIYSDNIDSIVEDMMIETVGQMFKQSFSSIINDYSKLLGRTVTVKEINDFLKTTNEQSLLRLIDQYNNSHNDRLEFGPDLHYRVTKTGLALNELLYEFSQNLYTKDKLHERIIKEKKNFIKDLVSKKVTIPYTDQLKTVANNFKNFEKEWVKDGNIILAKGVLNKEKVNIMYTFDTNVTDLELNPLLNSYFMVDNLLGNNLRYALTGNEVNHPVKALKKISINKLLTNLNVPYIKLFKPDFKTEQELTFYDLDQIIKSYEVRNNNGEFNSYTPEQKTQLEQFIKKVTEIYNNNLYLFENTSQSAQFKRNVAIPATMIRMIPKLNGISTTMNIACIEDVEARVFNFDGKKGGVDSCDGSAQINPLWSILENRSLNDSEVGWIKKPLHHDYDSKTATATLLKYATDTITNQWMRQAEGNINGIRLRDIFKKMTNFQWNFSDDLDLLRCDFKDSGGIDFNEDILEKVPLYYNTGNSHYQINDFGIENGVYYTIETLVDTFGGHLGESKKVYHYFDNNSKHIPSNTIISDPDYHTINSLFELHTALGGIYSESKNKNGELQYSEASNFATTNFIVHVATLKKGADPSDLSIKSYDQPLKRAMIHMIANHTAIKEGSRNMNPASAWFDSSPLRYMTLSTANYGIQQDADHEADKAFMTEFSQVINSLDAGGFLHTYIVEIYKQLGQTALDLAQVELDAIKEFRKSGNKSAVYDIIGRTIMANLRSGRNSAGLAEAIINNIRQKFNLNTDHSLDELKIPFSDKNIYGQILSTFVSNLNRKSIKRQYPGLGMPMVPSYNMSMIFDLNGQTYQFEDLIKEAYNRGYTSNEADISLRNRQVVQQLLNDEQASLPYARIEEFQPTDNIVCYFTAEKFNLKGLNTNEVEYEESTQREEHISLNDIEDYYSFKEDPIAYLHKKGYYNISNLQFKKDISRPRNLAPAKTSWKYIGADGDEHTMNIFDHPVISDFIHAVWQVENSDLSKPQKKQKILELRKQYNPQQVFSNLKKGFFVDREGTQYNIYDLQNTEAETIVSNIYKSTFGIKEGDSLVDILNAGIKYFSKPARLIISDNFDLAFTNRSGKHTYITFNSLPDTSDNFNYYRRKWSNIIRKKNDGENAVNKIYAVNRDNTILFEVGREIVRSDIQWDSDRKKFVQNGQVIKNQSNYRRDGDRVLEYVEFVTRNRVTEVGDNKTIRYNLYNINKEAIKRVLDKESYPNGIIRTDKATGQQYTITEDQKFEEDVNNFISSLLANIYKSDSFGGVQINKKLTTNSGDILKSTLHNFGTRLNYSPELSKYILKVDKLLKTVKPVEGYKISAKQLNALLKEYNNKLSNSIYSSFLKSLYFTSSRIPAQTLQSFMKMKVVGFTGVETGQCFVSVWQTYLQGSDSFVVGVKLCESGKTRRGNPNPSFVEIHRRINDQVEQPYQVELKVKHPRVHNILWCQHYII